MQLHGAGCGVDCAGVDVNALQLANRLNNGFLDNSTIELSVAMLRKQHEAIRQLRKDLKYMDDYLGDDKPISNFSKRVKAALAATENL